MLRQNDVTQASGRSVSAACAPTRSTRKPLGRHFRKGVSMLYVIVFVIAFILGYAFAVWGNMENLKKGKMFYRRDNGSWYPYDPRRSS
jgi:hypothetical protein